MAKPQSGNVDEHFTNVFARRDVYAVLLAIGTLIVLVLAYIPIIRAHQGWEDEIYWVSTCLSMLRHRGEVPSVLVDFPRPADPLRFYGPTMFWIGAGILKFFGFSMRTWRSFTFAGNVAYLAAVGVLFYRLRQSWTTAMGAVLFCSLSLGISFGISLPGRPDAWTVALFVLVLALVAKDAPEGEPSAPMARRWIAFGALLGVAVSTTPRVWPLAALMVVLLPLLVPRRRIQTMALVAGISFAVWSLILLPLRTTPWSFVASVRHAITGDTVDVTPLMSGSWGFGHSTTQIFYYGALLVVLGLVDISRWRRVPRFQRWLIVVAVLNLVVALVLTARALNMSAYWAFLLEIAALYAWTESAPPLRLRIARGIGAVLVVFMVTLRIARELPTWMHWHARNPMVVEQELRTNIPPGSVVYGRPGQYFYPSLAIGADYRAPVDSPLPGRASTPGQAGLPTPMRDACHAPAFLVWPAGKESDPLPPMPHATPERIANYANAPEQQSVLERIIERAPGGRSEAEHEEFTIFRLHPDPGYCSEIERASAR